MMLCWFCFPTTRREPAAKRANPFLKLYRVNGMLTYEQADVMHFFSLPNPLCRGMWFVRKRDGGVQLGAVSDATENLLDRCRGGVLTTACRGCQADLVFVCSSICSRRELLPKQGVFPNYMNC